MAGVERGKLLPIQSNEKIESFCDAVLQGDAERLSLLGEALREGRDLLGDACMRVNESALRRADGCTYTPRPLVEEMVGRVSAFDPELVVDCGCGSGRFALACAHAFPRASVLAVDRSELACKMCRANAVASGLSGRVDVVCCDFTKLVIDRRGRRVLWIGNPPYVRHHDIEPTSKAWFKDACGELGVRGSGLAGMHVHFLARIAQLWEEGDYGLLLMNAEWLDANYGETARELLCGKLGMDYLRLFDRREEIFSQTLTTALVVGFGAASGAVEVRFSGGESRDVALREFRSRARWSSVVSGNGAGQPAAEDSGLVPLGSLARVHRGVVTGNNAFWVRRREELEGVPESLTVPVVSHARELMGECVAQSSPEELSRLIVIPETLDDLAGAEARAAREIIEEGRRRGIDRGYVASHRKAWWSVRPPKAPAVLMTYMGRNAPTFVVNERGLPMLNVVHGLYPVQELSAKALGRLVDYLNVNVDLGRGRMYCGGLVKYEPREAEAIPVPPLSELEA